jgi:hypothetical protein
VSRDYGTPPRNWPGLEMTDLTRLTEDIYYGWAKGHANPVLWHRCAALADVPEERTVHGPWVATNTEGHTLLSREPLHLEPSLLWQCCGLHGWVRGGTWTPA